ncbi:MAG: heme-copper oxidase subunit III [Candidatus Caldarchaeum sp.]|nr:heme-copper oxidase subunit III [Candidatus Caldarchaeum sp.]MCS7137609.1 heme-copper oxidase subunit III [Candidatus Caldarchaeum sp.]MDW7978057.1 heme-copper oxidase subunit III [Candidatus Caldarchaeum sp.]MDW8359173.1 heme-copper oxidase subunit III [Candidatus Caldarchaeum sp.]
MESQHEEHEGSIWPAVIGMAVLVLVAGVILILRGINLILGLGLVLVFVATLAVFVSREVKAWPHVIESFFARLKGTAIPSEPERVSGVGMPTAMFLFTEVALFGAGFGSYFLIRSSFPVWPPPDAPHLDDFIPRLQTFMLLFSSLAIEYATYSVKRDRLGAVLGGVVATALFGTGFLVLKLGVEWPHLIFDLGFTPDTGVYASMFYILLGAHGAHVFGGVVALGVVAWRAKLRQFSSHSYGLLESVSIYWHFVHLVWLLLFAFIYEGALLWTHSH